MTHTQTNKIAAGMFALALAIALAFSTTTVAASARTFNFNSAGSMVQQPLPPQWACIMQRALTSGTFRFPCRESSIIKASPIRGDAVAAQRWVAAAIATGHEQHRTTAH